MGCQIPQKKRCPTDERNYLEIEGDCFYLETENFPYTEAQANCDRNKFSSEGRLFEPGTLAENNNVLKAFGKLLGEFR